MMAMPQAKALLCLENHCPAIRKKDRGRHFSREYDARLALKDGYLQVSLANLPRFLDPRQQPVHVIARLIFVSEFFLTFVHVVSIITLSHH